MKIDLEIDRLAVPGVTPFTRAQLTAALERELERLAGVYGLPSRWKLGEIEIDRATVRLASGSSPSEIGVEIARQLVAGLHREAGQVPWGLAHGPDAPARGSGRL